MSERRIRFIDIESKSKSSTSAEDRAERPLWTRSDNTFKFNFLSADSPVPQETTSEPDKTEPVTSRISFTKQGSAFAFNFQIPPDTPVDMEATETPDSCSSSSQKCVQDKSVSSSSEPSVQNKAKKKKKKSGKKKVSDNTEPQQKPAEESKGREETELSAEEQLNRELNWCIEQLELGIGSQKATPKQKDEASRALKTLRSTKAPLAKKRQVMRVMAGDYRKKMEEEKSKQFKLIQRELASAQVKVASGSPKKSVFHRKAEIKTQTSDRDVNLQQTNPEVTDQTQLTQEEKSAFVFTPSKEQFHFNFF